MHVDPHTRYRRRDRRAWRDYHQTLLRAAEQHGLDTHGEGTPAYQQAQEAAITVYRRRAAAAWEAYQQELRK